MKLPLASGNLQRDVAAIFELLRKYRAYAERNVLDGCEQDFNGIAEEHYNAVAVGNYMYAVMARQLFKRMDYPARYRLYRHETQTPILCVECFGLHLAENFPKPLAPKEVAAQGFYLSHVSGANPQEPWKDVRAVQ